MDEILDFSEDQAACITRQNVNSMLQFLSDVLAAVAQSVKRLELRYTRADMSLIPGGGIGAREKILASPSLGVGGKRHVCK